MTSYDLILHLVEQRAFSENTFGPGARDNGILDHIEKELKEVRANPKDLYEWIDLVMLSLDGAWRAGFTPEEIAHALWHKLEINKKRRWPDWRAVPQGSAIEHDRTEDTR